MSPVRAAPSCGKQLATDLSDRAHALVPGHEVSAVAAVHVGTERHAGRLRMTAGEEAHGDGKRVEAIAMRVEEVPLDEAVS